jgi:hypothetical protein
MAIQSPSWTMGSVGLFLDLDWIITIVLMLYGKTVTLVQLPIQSHGGACYRIAKPQLTRLRWGAYGDIFPRFPARSSHWLLGHPVLHFDIGSHRHFSCCHRANRHSLRCHTATVLISCLARSAFSAAILDRCSIN